MILIVDDDSAVAEICVMMLESYGYQASTARSGADAIAKLAAQDVDLMVADCVMPDMGGLELSRQLRVVQKSTAMPIVLMSGSLQSDVAVGSTYDAFLRKPFLAEHLLAQVQRLLPNLQRSTFQELQLA
jgi:two-component system chemotaxis response regulator CheY